MILCYVVTRHLTKEEFANEMDHYIFFGYFTCISKELS